MDSMGGVTPTLGFCESPMPVHQAISTALKTIRRVTGGRVTYQRGNQSVKLTAAVGEKLHRVDDLLEGTAIRTRSRDYLIGVGELKLNHTLITPQRGDKIVDGVNTYEVTNIVDGEPAWVYSDTGQSTYRIHTVKDN